VCCCELTLCSAHHHGGDAFAEVRMRHADHRAFDHARQCIDDLLDLDRVHIVAAGDDEVLVAPDDVHIAIGIDAPQVAGDEETVTEIAGLAFGHAPVPLEYI